MGEREALLQGEPEAFFITPTVTPSWLEDAWRVQAPKRLVAGYEAQR